MTPPFLLGAAVLFWGWQTGLWPFAIVLAPVLELARVTEWRWDIARRDVNRISDLCSLILVGLTVYAFATAGARTPGAPSAFARLFQWLPIAFGPLVACQLYSVSGRLETSTLFWTLRRRAARTGAATPATVDLTYVYVVVCVLSASAANGGAGFYTGLCALAAWALWPARSPRARAAVWAVLLVVAGGVGYAGQIGLRVLQQRIEHLVLEYVLQSRGDSDPFRSTTSLGALGRLKLSERVVLRVTPHDAIRLPLLLRDATYNFYHGGSWYAIDARFTPVTAEGDGETWKLNAAHGGHHRRVTVSTYLRGGRGVLPLPHDAFEIDRLAVVALGKNRLGTVKVDDGTDLVTYTALSATGAAVDGPPEGADLRLPLREAAIVRSIANDLGLQHMSAARAVNAVEAHFASGFRYSTWTAAEQRPPGRALEEFLVRTRTGHCEYFATATALLLRAADIPARYAVGYSVQEWSRLEGAYVARARHAHAWTRAWVDGRWIDVDTTPPSWVEEERGAATWQLGSDAWEWVAFQFSRWRLGAGGDGPTRYLVWLLVPLVLFVAWRIHARTRRARRAGVSARPRATVASHAVDSEFYLIERRLAAAGLERRPCEPATAWVRRLGTGVGFDDVDRARGVRSSVPALTEIVALHDRYRFDPVGLSPEERRVLREKATAWLDAHARESAGAPRG